MPQVVGIVPRIDNQDAAQLARELCAWLGERGVVPLVEAEAGVLGAPVMPGFEMTKRADMDAFAEVFKQ